MATGRSGGHGRRADIRAGAPGPVGLEGVSECLRRHGLWALGGLPEVTAGENPQ